MKTKSALFLTAALLVICQPQWAQAKTSQIAREHDIERSLASLKQVDPLGDTPRWQEDSKAFNGIEQKPVEKRVSAESDEKLVQSFQKSPYLNYYR